MALPAQPTAALEAMLSEGLPALRLTAIRRLRHRADRVARLLASALIVAAARRLGLPFGSQDVRYPPKAAPHWPDGPRLSVSHCAEHVVLLVGATAVGVDIETPGSACMADLRHVLRPGALEGIGVSGPDPTEIWMQIEAAVKTGSEGIAAASELVFEDVRTARLRGQRIYLHPVRCTARLTCWCAMTVPWAEDPIRVYPYTAEDLAGLLASPTDRRIPGHEGRP